MGDLQHLKWPMAVIIPFILSLYGASGVLIDYSAHNCRYSDFTKGFMAKISLIWEIFSWLWGAGSILRNLNALKLLSNQSNPLLLHFKWFADPGVAYILIFCLFPILKPHLSIKKECWAIFTWFWVPGANYITCMAYLCIVTFSKPFVQTF